MTTNSIIFIILACFALVLFIVAIRVFNRNRLKKNNDQAVQNSYLNEQIYVGNLPYRVDEGDLRGYFSRFGAVETIKVVRNFRTGRSKGYAFVTYADAKQAVGALAAHGKDLHGRSMVVRIAKPRQLEAY